MTILIGCVLLVGAGLSVPAAIQATVATADWLEDMTGLLWPAIPAAFIIWALEFSLVGTLFYTISEL